MQFTVGVARVETPTTIYDKAIVAIEGDIDAPTTVTIRNRQGVVLETIEGPVLEPHRPEDRADLNMSWTVGGALVIQTPGCGCGGTAVTSLVDSV